MLRLNWNSLWRPFRRHRQVSVSALATSAWKLFSTWEDAAVRRMLCPDAFCRNTEEDRRQRSRSNNVAQASLKTTQVRAFNSRLSGTTRLSRYQKGKTNLDFTEARDSEWHQPGHMQVCTLLQTDNHASTPPLSFFTGRMPFLPQPTASKHRRQKH